MSAYEELVERCCMLFRELESSAPNDEFTHRAYVKTLLTSVLRTLETVTQEMVQDGGVELDNCKDSSWDSGGDGESHNSYEWIISGSQTQIYLAMLRASPLASK